MSGVLLYEHALNIMCIFEVFFVELLFFARKSAFLFNAGYDSFPRKEASWREMLAGLMATTPPVSFNERV